MSKPRDAHSLAERQPFHTGAKCIDPPDDFVARNDRHMRVWQLAVHDVQIRAAHTASAHLHANLARPRLPVRQFGPGQRRSKSIENHGVQGRLFCVVYGSFKRYLRIKSFLVLFSKKNFFLPPREPTRPA